MAATRTLAQLRAMVRQLADQETLSPTDALVDNTELDARINEALRQLYDLLIEARGQEFYVDSTSFVSVEGQSKYPLPARFYQLLGVRVYDGNIRAQCPIWTYQMLADLEQLGDRVADHVGRFHYRLQSSNIAIQPTPQSTRFTFYIDYVPKLDELAADNDTFDGVNGWEKWAAYTAAIDIANKEENYELVQALMPQRALLQAQIEKLARDRDAGLPHGTQDTRRDWGGSRWSFFDPDGFTNWSSS